MTSGMVMKPSGSSPSYAYEGRRHCQLGVRSRSESHRSVRHEFATSPRSSTTWSMDRSDRRRLIASPPWPAPMTTVVVFIGAAPQQAIGGSDDLDPHVGRIGDDVVHR